MPDPDTANKVEEGYVEPSDEMNEEQRFEEDDVGAEELEKDLEVAAKNSELQEKVLILEGKFKKYEDEKKNEAESNAVDPDFVDAGANMKLKRIERRRKQKLRKMERCAWSNYSL